MSPPPSLPIVEACFTGADCIPGQGAVNEDCDFSQTALFPNLDAHGAVLSRSNFTGAHLAGADLRGAVLEDACFVGANLSNARLDNSTVLDGAIFCRTLMPDGSINDRDCDRGTACCPTPPPICQREVCAGDCISTINQLCSIFGNPCCDQGVCIPELVNPLFTFCQWPCDTDSDCTSVFGGGVVCGHDVNFCLGMGGDDKCCRPA